MKVLAIFVIYTCSLSKFDAGRIYFPDEIPDLQNETPKSILPTTEALLQGNFKQKEISAPNVGSDFLQGNFKQEEVSAPNVGRDFLTCGYTYKLGVFSGILLNNKTYVPIYHLNKTAKKLASEGLKIYDQNVSQDVLFNFTFSNGTFTETIGYEFYQGVAPVGGKPASYIRAYYMAQLGEIISSKIIWLCDGVLINRQWILSAAHCFVSHTKPNIIRLGDYNISEPVEEGFNIRGKFIEDYPIAEIVPFPEFNERQRYHDLVLIKIPKKIPKYSTSINPICLPWGNHTNLNLVGSEVVLTGWGATEYGGSKTEVLQEVDLKVFNTSACDMAYSEVRDNHNKYPEGLTEDKILCIGWEEDGKDACKGDSGAPVVYQEGGKIHGNFILAGIVSGGYGCGLKEYPGLYIPINKPKYLRWIKEIAFKEYN